MKVLSFGSLNIDYVYEVDHFVKAGETLSSFSLTVFPGGKGLNQSIALAKSGLTVFHAGAVGAQDSVLLLDALTEAGVQTDYIRKVDGASGHAIIQRDMQGQNCILLHGGANQKIDAELIAETLQSFGPGDWLVLQNEINANAEIIKTAKARGLSIALNPSPMDAKVLALPLEDIDYFLLNETEAMQILGLDAEPDPDEALDQLLVRFPAARFVLTLGGAGSVFASATERVKQAIYRVAVVDTTAAGDTFSGYFISALMAGKSPAVAMDEASKAAAIAVSRAGAAPSIPTRAEVEGFQA